MIAGLANQEHTTMSVTRKWQSHPLDILRNRAELAQPAEFLEKSSYRNRPRFLGYFPKLLYFLEVNGWKNRCILARCVLP